MSENCFLTLKKKKSVKKITAMHCVIQNTGKTPVKKLYRILLTVQF